MSSVLGSMNSGVAAVDQDLKVVAWNARSEDLWGIRADEAVGEHLFNLDIGLPLEPIRPVLRDVQNAEDGTPQVVEVDAVNRRGRSIDVRVTVSRLTQDGEATAGALLVMDVLGAHDG
jgi:two-component system CheB/CheR fusion protein